MISTPEEYVRALQSGRVDTVKGVCGRILRGQEEKDFETLTDDPANRKVVFPTDESGLESLLGKNGYEMLVTIGYPPDYIESLVSKGKKFKLVVFPEGKDAVAATWMNVIRVVSEAYPEVRSRLWTHGQVLMTYGQQNWDQFERVTGLKSKDLNAIKSNGSGDPGFMTFERYKVAPDSPENARLFLYYTVGLNNLFHGDGFTRDENGKRGIKEYLMVNKNITDIVGAKVVDLQVTVP